MASCRLTSEQIGCDLLAATGRKYFRGPRGTGFLYVRDSVLEQLDPPLLDIRAATWVAKDRYELRRDARRFESWEGNVAAKIGLGVAVDYALQWGLETIWTRIQHLGTALRSQLETIPGVTVHDLGQTRCGIVTFTVDGHEPATICEQLAVQGINVSFATVASTRLDMEAAQPGQCSARLGALLQCRSRDRAILRCSVGDHWVKPLTQDPY